MNKFKRYKKSTILLSAGVTAGTIITLLIQQFCSQFGPPRSPEQEAGATPPARRLAGIETFGRAAPAQQSSNRIDAPPVPVQHPSPQTQTFSNSAASPAVSSQSYAAALQSYTPQAPASASNYSIQPPGATEYGRSTSGYPFAMGQRAVNSCVAGGSVLPASQGGGATSTIDPRPGANVIIDPTPGLDMQQMTVTRNGLLGNPCADPPSCRGQAYSRVAQ